MVQAVKCLPKEPFLTHYKSIFAFINTLDFKITQKFSRRKYDNKSRQKLRYNYGREYGKNDKGWNLPEQKAQENLELAYAISVHKLQGSEFDYVYIVIPKRDSHLLSMELLYTAIT